MSTERGVVIKFIIRPGSPLFLKQPRARALPAWRAAADLVWTRWELLREAAPETRAGAFAAYNAALDAEAAAAATLADMRPHEAV
jgi:hypothetical protein